ncbi:hypothetical protein J6590_021192 [Homalodisca vitripennis]|nr:hypothetical protein J6590_021192 [Homalodisca vitripennis]
MFWCSESLLKLHFLVNLPGYGYYSTRVCKERVKKILKACTKDVIRGLGPDFSNISLARDKTKQDLDHLRKELSRRLKEGEVNLTITLLDFLRLFSQKASSFSW